MQTYPNLPDLREALPRLCRHPSYHVCQRPNCETLETRAQAQRREDVAWNIFFALAALALAVSAIVFPSVREVLGSLISALAPWALNLTLSAAALFGLLLLVAGTVKAGQRLFAWLSGFKLARFVGHVLSGLAMLAVALMGAAYVLGVIVVTIGIVLALLDGVL